MLMFARKYPHLLGLLGLFVLLVGGCGGEAVQSLDTKGPQDSAAVAVGISPQSSAILAGQSVQFTASVSGSSNTQVNWLVNGALGGNSSAGTIASGGYYSAPATASPQQVTVQAVSQADPSASATASVAINGAGLVTSTINPQVANYSVTSPQAGTASVEFGTDTNYGFQTASQQIPAGGGTGSILVAGMRAFTTYHMRAVIQYANGATFTDADHTFTTGGLDPTRVPQVSVSQPSALEPNPGVELLDLDGNTGSCANCVDVAAEDLNGNLIWYYDPGQSLGTPNPIKLLPDGHILVNFTQIGDDGFSSDLREIDLAGNTVWEMTAAQLNLKLAAAGYNLTMIGTHHDFAILPNGHLILIASTYQSFTDLPGYPGTTQVIGDVLIDLDQNHNPVWVWNSFDHLDVNRHPMKFPDWTHSNAVLYSPDDGDLILSMRHQNWVIKIDYEDGHGTGNILWRLGFGGDFTLQGGDSPIDWQYAQHAILLFGPASAGIFQLGLFDNGNDRIVDSAGDLCGTAGQPACYSRLPIFQINETAKTADIVWQYKLPVFSDFGGYVQPLANGDVEFDEAQPSPNSAAVFEVTNTTSPQVVWQMNITNQNAYRAFRIPSLYPGVQW